MGFAPAALAAPLGTEAQLMLCSLDAEGYEVFDPYGTILNKKSLSYAQKVIKDHYGIAGFVHIGLGETAISARYGHVQKLDANGVDYPLLGAIFGDPIHGPPLTKTGDGSTDFDGVDDYITFDASFMGGVTGVAVSAWIRPDNAASGATQYIVSMPGSWLLYVNSVGRVGFDRYSGGAYFGYAHPTILVSGQTYHVYADYNGSDIKIWVNGVLSTSGSVTGTPGAATTVAIGAWTSGANLFNGLIDEVLLSRRSNAGHSFVWDQYYQARTGLSTANPDTDVYYIEEITGLGDAQIRDTRDAHPARDGEHAYPSFYSGRTINIRGKIYAGNLAKLREMERDLKQMFSDITQEKSLVFMSADDDQTRWVRLLGRKSGEITLTDASTNTRYCTDFVVPFRASDPRVESFIEHRTRFSPNVLDDFSSNTLGANYWVEEVGTGWSITGGQLAPTTASEKVLIRSGLKVPLYTFNSRQSIKWNPGASWPAAVTRPVGLVLRYVNTTTFLFGCIEVASSGGSAILALYKRVSGTTTLLTSTAITVPSVNTNYWLRATISGGSLDAPRVGSSVTVEHFTADPELGGAATNTISHTLSAGDQSTFSFSAFFQGIYVTLANTLPRFDDYRQKPTHFQMNPNNVDILNEDGNYPTYVTYEFFGSLPQLSFGILPDGSFDVGETRVAISTSIPGSETFVLNGRNRSFRNTTTDENAMRYFNPTSRWPLFQAASDDDHIFLFTGGYADANATLTWRWRDSYL